MKTVIGKATRNSIFAKNVVSQLVKSVSLRQQSLQRIESQIEDLKRDAESERQKINELKMAINQLCDFSVNN
jgi:peptidoglycan hydrolase CwlO-like protein